ncbi:tRNAHis-5'-guanylyltransferase [Labilithrix luteola]|uniref:tRNA(His) guanylyltransferase n=1 Tax=Labilithrix luteola TaxID=1391654 RepID=A0A0K1QFC0_9BACT|nr:tRNA(His) guanylyltransferase Thg1 family protein [Labilithrix luteola]AKV04130.1 tRNAHis-5'-guanylyltransferase [Labilithrix luteola]
MKFEQLDRRMRVYETAHDHCVLPGLHMVARIDGRSFSQLTRVTENFEAPYDVRFRDCMVATLEHLFSSTGFSVLFGYTQSDEMSLLLRRDESLFGRKLRKLHSVLAGEASAKFSLSLGRVAAFDARISQLPDVETVIDYFRWRYEDAHRNALNGHSYWLLRRQGLDDNAATQKLKGVSVADRNELLFRAGINFNDVPAWEKRGIGIYWKEEPHIGSDPRTGAEVISTRRRAVLDFDLPMKTAFDDFVRDIVTRQ